jgi:hypothetical protein
MIVRNTKQTLQARSEIERTASKEERVQEKADFFISTSLFFVEVLKTDNMNTEDILQQNTTHTLSERTGGIPVIKRWYWKGQTPIMVLEREGMAQCGGT